jgi:hypothetical protein
LSLLPSTSGGNWIPDYLVTKIVLLIEMPSWNGRNWLNV